MGIREKDDSEVFETSRPGFVLIETHQLDKLLDDGYNIDLAVSAD